MTKKQWIADGLLLAAAIIWGSAFAVVKNTLDSVPPSMMIALRFGIAALISGVILRKHLRGLTRGQVLMGLLVGVLTGLAYIVQTIGLQDTTAGKNAFLTTIYVLLVPFGSAVLFHEKLGARRYVAAVLMLLGIGILSLDGESGGLNRGDVLTLVCGVLYAAQIISVGRCNERMDTYALIVLEFAFAALTGLCWSLATERGDADTVEHAVHRRHFVCRGVLNHAGIVLPEYRAEARTDVSCGAVDEPRIRVRGAVRRDFSGRKADHPNGTGLSGDFRGGGAERNDGIIKKNSRKMYEYALTSG